MKLFPLRILMLVMFCSQHLSLKSQDTLQTASGLHILVSPYGTWEPIHHNPQKFPKDNFLSFIDNHSIKLKSDLISRLLDQDAEITADIFFLEQALLKTDEKLNTLRSFNPDNSSDLLDVRSSIDLLSQRYLSLMTKREIFEKCYAILNKPVEIIDQNFLESQIRELLGMESGQPGNSELRTNNALNFIRATTSTVSPNTGENTCILSFEGIDPGTGLKRKDAQPQHFFSYTRPEYQQILDGKPYISCQLQVSQLGGYYFLSLYFTLNSTKSEITYGYVASGSRLQLTLLNGRVIYFTLHHASSPNKDYKQNTTEFIATYAIDKSALDHIAQMEVDKVSIEWRQGQEEYEIYHIDALMAQFRCLNIP